MLIDKRSSVVDAPPQIFRFGLPQHDRLARTFEPFIAAHFSDREAWDALFNDDFRLQVAKEVWGPRLKTKKRKRNARQGTLELAV